MGGLGSWRPWHGLLVVWPRWRVDGCCGGAVQDSTKVGFKGHGGSVGGVLRWRSAGAIKWEVNDGGREVVAAWLLQGGVGQ